MGNTRSASYLRKPIGGLTVIITYDRVDNGMQCNYLVMRKTCESKEMSESKSRDPGK